VIKPLGKVFRQFEGGAIELGSGEIALILDVQALAQVAHKRADFAGDVLKRELATNSGISHDPDRKSCCLRIWMCHSLKSHRRLSDERFQ
jgi:chemotaxis protein histidine kinase CheA